MQGRSQAIPSRSRCNLEGLQLTDLSRFGGVRVATATAIAPRHLRCRISANAATRPNFCAFCASTTVATAVVTPHGDYGQADAVVWQTISAGVLAMTTDC